MDLFVTVIASEHRVSEINTDLCEMSARPNMCGAIGMELVETDRHRLTSMYFNCLLGSPIVVNVRCSKPAADFFSDILIPQPLRTEIYRKKEG